MYGVFNPVIIYGVAEPSDESYIDLHNSMYRDSPLMLACDGTVRCHGTGLKYGVAVGLFNVMHDREKIFSKYDQLLENFKKHAKERYNVDLPEQNAIYLCLSVDGDVDLYEFKKYPYIGDVDTSSLGWPDGSDTEEEDDE